MSTSEGRCFSKAAISGALQDVCPPTIALNFVAAIVRSSKDHRHGEPTRTIFCHNSVDILGFNAVDDIVTAPRNKMAIWKDRDILLHTSSAKLRRTMYRAGIPDPHILCEAVQNDRACHKH
jgi:hypothetical protein